MSETAKKKLQLWVDENQRDTLTLRFRVEKTLLSGESDFQYIDIVEDRLPLLQLADSQGSIRVADVAGAGLGSVPDAVRRESHTVAIRSDWAVVSDGASGLVAVGRDTASSRTDPVDEVARAAGRRSGSGMPGRGEPGDVWVWRSWRCGSLGDQTTSSRTPPKRRSLP